MISHILKAAAAVLVLVGAVFLGNRWHYVRLRRQHGCEDPPSYKHADPIFGLDLFLKTGKEYEENRYLPELSRLFERNRDTFQAINMGKRNIYTIEPENLRTIFSANASQWGVQPIRLAPMQPFCGRGFLTVDGDLWHRSRKLFQPSFEKKAIANFTALESFVTKMLSQVPGDRTTVDMQPLLSSLFIDATTLFLFGESISQLTGSVTSSEVAAAFDEAMYGSGMRIALGPLGFLAKSKKWLRACAIAQSFATTYVEKALDWRRKVEAGQVLKNEKSNVLLYSLAEQLDDKEHLRNDILQAFFVSQGTTANCVSNVLWLVSRKAGLWKKLREEALRISSATAPPTYEQLQHMQQLRKTINEALRLFPVLPQNNRVALTDTVLPVGGGQSGQSPIFVKAGTMVCVSYYTLHRQEKRWGSDAASFDPDRWDRIEGSKSYEYLPFGAGPRQCIGREKALIEASYVLVRLMQEFANVESRDSREWQGRVQLSAQNLHGCQVAFQGA